MKGPPAKRLPHLLLRFRFNIFPHLRLDPDNAQSCRLRCGWRLPILRPTVRVLTQVVQGQNIHHIQPLLAYRRNPPGSTSHNRDAEPRLEIPSWPFIYPHFPVSYFFYLASREPTLLYGNSQARRCPKNYQARV